MSTSSTSEMPVRRRVAAASIWVTIGMLAGRFTGILREFLIADTFGVSREADVAILLVTGPEMLVTIAGTGAFGLVLIPILLDHDVATQLRLVRRLTIRLGAVAVLLALVASGLVLAFATNWATGSGLSAGTFRTAVLVTSLAVPTSMTVVLTAEFLRAQNRFAVVSFATVTFTLPVLIAIVMLRSVVGVAVGVAIGGALRYLVQLAIVRREADPGKATDIRVAGAVRAGDMSAAFLISVMLAGQVSIPLLLAAAIGDTGDVALLNYGWRILLIPIGLLGSIFSVAAYPSIVRLLQDTTRPPQRAVAGILRPTILLSVLIGCWLWLNASSAIRAVYGPTGLDDVALGAIAAEVRAGSLAIPLVTIGTAATTLLFGIKRSWSGLVPYLLATPILILLGALLLNRMGPEGVMWAMSVYAAVLCASAMIVTWRTAGFAVLGRSDVPVVVTAAATCGALGLLMRTIFPGSSLGTVAVNGVAYLVCSVGAFAAYTRLRR